MFYGRLFLLSGYILRLGNGKEAAAVSGYVRFYDNFYLHFMRYILFFQVAFHFDDWVFIKLVKLYGYKGVGTESAIRSDLNPFVIPSMMPNPFKLKLLCVSRLRNWHAAFMKVRLWVHLWFLFFLLFLFLMFIHL